MIGRIGRKLKLYQAVAVGVLTSLPAMAAPSVPGKTFTSSHHTVSAMCATSEYVWLGTVGEGLLRYDKRSGVTMLFSSSNSGLHNDSVWSLAVDTGGALLAGTYSRGIDRFDGLKWDRLPDLPDKAILNIGVDAHGVIWAGSNNTGVVKLENGTWTAILNRFSGKMTVNPSGSVWVLNMPQCNAVGCINGGIYEFVNGGLQSTTAIDDKWNELSYPNSFAVDGKRTIWMGVQQRLLRFTGNSFTSFQRPGDTLPDIQVSAIAVNHNDVLCTAINYYMAGSDIFLYDPAGNTGTPLDSVALAFNNLFIDVICADPDGSFWLAASDGTLFNVDITRRITTHRLGNSLLPHNTITAMLIDRKGDIWIGTGNGIGRYNGTGWTAYPGAGDTLPGRAVGAMALDSSGAPWVGYYQPIFMSSLQCGISRFVTDPVSCHWGRFNHAFISVKMMAFDRQGTLLVGADDGIYRFRDTIGEQLLKTGSFDSELQVNTMALDGNNTLWIGTGSGIKRYENDRWINDTAIGNKLPGGTVHCILFDPFNISWFGTDKGLARCNDSVCTLFTAADGILPVNTVQCVAVESSGSVWIGTARGLVHLTGTTRQLFTTENSSLCCNDITALAIDHTGQLWAGTRVGGVTVFPEGEELTVKHATPEPARHDAIMVASRRLARSGVAVSLTGDRLQEIMFSVITLKGERVRRIDVPPATGASVTIVWDGTDGWNRTVPPGIYLGIATHDGKIVGRVKLPR